MRIAFVLPGPVRVPQGGALVVERHAAGLAAMGHDVTVTMPHSFGGLASWARSHAFRVWNRRQGILDTARSIDGVTAVEPARLRPGDLDAYDAVIATGHQTANAIHLSKARGRFYFIQGDERQLSRHAAATWHLPLSRFAVSHWLKGRIESQGLPVVGVVPNGVDPHVWGCDRPVERRKDRVVALYHRHPIKGPDTLIVALTELRRLRPTVRADVFAARTPRHAFPAWVRVRVRPSPDVLRKMYNRAAVCLHTSVVEGWGMVPMEAAACGCAVVATASLGPREYLTPGLSMTEVAVGDGLALARQAARLLRSPEVRIHQAGAALDAVARFRWEDSTAALEQILIRDTR